MKLRFSLAINLFTDHCKFFISQKCLTDCYLFRDPLVSILLAIKKKQVSSSFEKKESSNDERERDLAIIGLLHLSYLIRLSQWKKINTANNDENVVNNT